MATRAGLQAEQRPEGARGTPQREASEVAAGETGAPKEGNGGGQGLGGLQHTAKMEVRGSVIGAFVVFPADTREGATGNAEVLERTARELVPAGKGYSPRTNMGPIGSGEAVGIESTRFAGGTRGFCSRRGWGYCPASLFERPGPGPPTGGVQSVFFEASVIPA